MADGVRVRVGVTEADLVGVTVGVGVGVVETVGVPDTVGVTVGVSETVGVSDAVIDGVFVGVTEAVGVNVVVIDLDVVRVGDRDVEVVIEGEEVVDGLVDGYNRSGVHAPQDDSQLFITSAIAVVVIDNDRPVL